ncbi:MAG TPA: sulfotransferase domain-containing protein [Solirubrobacteraceae bacterium]|jgi:hypothetical protein|nr:sulfotransferase domain-containing protein [Solirubrobacteraceae bacterium]
MEARKEILDFIVIGAQKAGTTSLFEYLRLHPEVSLPAGKEAPYFSHDALYELGWGAYMRKLALTHPERKWGTVTTHYMVGGVYQSSVENLAARVYDERTVPRRIHERLPEARLIAILRDPVERALSHFRMRSMEGQEPRSWERAVDELLAPEMLERARRDPREETGYVAWGEYGRILSGYLDVFAREQLLVIFTEELERDPAGLLARVQEFIGVRSDFQPSNIGTRYRVGAAERRFAWIGPYSPLSPQGLQRRLTASPRARRLWRRVPESMQRQVRHPYERFAFRVALWNRRGEPAASPAPALETERESAQEELRGRLREHYAADAELLIARTGVRPPWLHAGEPAR